MYKRQGLTTQPQIFAGAIANFLEVIGLPHTLVFTLINLAVSAFALTSLDSVARVGRLSFQEFFQDNDVDEKDYTPFRKLMVNKYFATILTLVLAYLLAKVGYAEIWPLFGSANQLLSVLALVACAVFLKKTKRQGIMLWAPAVFMMAVTFSALGLTTVSYTHLVQPLINSISLYYVNHGIYVDFGIGRGVGSASYAVAASFLGILIGRYYGLAIMGVGCLSFAVMFVTLISMPVVKDPNESKKEEQKNTANRQRGGGILKFACRYRNYMLVLLGMILIYVESTYVNNYLINIVVSLGGDIKRMGTLLTVSAMSELPTMLLFSRLVGKWDSRKLIRFAAVMFSVKALGYLVCGSISFLYVVQMLQMLSFALCLPSAVRCV